MSFSNYLELNEAYTFLPNTVDDIESQNFAEEDDIIDIWLYVMDKSNNLMPNPLAIDSKKPLNIKIARAVAALPGLENIAKDLKKKFPKFKIDVGNGSRGGRGAGNKGIGFEKIVGDDIQKYIEEGMSADFKLPDLMRKIYDEILSKIDGDFTIEMEGSKNQKRSWAFNGKEITSAANTLNIGYLLTDITLVPKKGQKIYLSLKLKSSNVMMANLGLATVIPANTYMSDKRDKKVEAFLEYLGMSYDDYMTFFQNLMDKKSNENKEVDITSKVKKNYENLLAQSIGYGYWLVTTDEVKYIDEAFLKKAVSIQKLELVYPGKAKYIYTKIYSNYGYFKLQIRNRSGSGNVIPNVLDVFLQRVNK